MRTQNPLGGQDERKKSENFRVDRNGTFGSHVCIIYSANMERRSRIKNTVYTAFSRRGQLYYMDGLRAFKRETRLSFVGGKFPRRYFRHTCNNSRILIDPMRGRRKSLLLFRYPLST